MQVKDVNYGKTVRKSYAKYQEILQMPNLLKIQKDSYDWFLREGLHEVFRDVAAISDYTGNLELSFRLDGHVLDFQNVIGVFRRFQRPDRRFALGQKRRRFARMLRNRHTLRRLYGRYNGRLR